jgi:hypothetical protein
VLNKQGNSLVVSVKDVLSNRVYLEKKLDSQRNIIEYPRKAYDPSDKGVRVGFFNVSVGNMTSENIVKEVSLVPAPVNWLDNTKILAAGNLPVTTPIELTNIHKLNPVMYSVNNLVPGDRVIFKQSYDNGWVALGGGNHGRFEGWANTWEVYSPTLFIVFLPGLLQLICYILILPATSLYILVSKLHKHT